MRNPFRFFLELTQQPMWIPLWVLSLLLVNMASVAFWSEPLAMASHCRSAANMADCILERVRAFVAGAQRDDLTLIIAELTP